MNAGKTIGIFGMMAAGVACGLLLSGAADEGVAPFQYEDARIAFYPPKDAPGILQEAPAQMQLPVSPGESLKHLQVPEGFEARLFAAEPDIVKVIAMTWDARGRLWVAETVDYPNNLTEAPHGQDRIKICADTDGDGVADTFTVFADTLSIPTSLVFANGGLIVAQAPDTLFLKDTDGDDVADVREVLFSGWGTADTHSGPSNFRMGLDNWIWGTVGYSGFDGEVGGVRKTFRMGILRFKPDGSALEYLSSTTNNTWGLGIGEEGDIFASTANGDHSDYMAIPNRYYERVRGYSGRGTAAIFDHKEIHPVTPRVRQVDWHGQFTAAAGCAVYTARTYPEFYWNRVAFVTEPTGHLVHQCILESDGSSFVSRDGWNLVASDDEWTAPVAAEVGPDGHVWISDWYNYIVQHNPTPQGFENGKGNAYETPLRDKTHGRVYRIVYTDAAAASLNLDNATEGDLVAALGHANMFWRLTAQRILVERQDKALIPALESLLKQPQTDAIGNAPGVLHALSALEGLGYFENSGEQERQVLRDALAHPAPAVRRRALQIAASVEHMGDDAVPLLADPDSRVRLQALLALSEAGETARGAEALAALIGDETIFNDAWLPEALTMAGAQCAEPFLRAVAHLKGEAGADEVVRAVANHYARGAKQEQLAELLSDLQAANADVRKDLLAGLSEGWPGSRSPRNPGRIRRALARLGEELPTEDLLPAMVLARKWDMDAVLSTRQGEVVEALSKDLANAGLSGQERIEVARQLVSLAPGSASRGLILDQISIETPPDVSEGLLSALRAEVDTGTAIDLLSRYEAFTPKVRSQALDTLLARGDWSHAFLDAVEAGSLIAPALSVVQRRTLLHAPDEKLRARAKALLLAPHENLDASRAEIVRRLMPLTEQAGDAELGRRAFSENCGTCHRFNGEGGKVGPDLTGIAGGNRVEILTAMVDPNRSVEGNFRQWLVETKEGEYLSGLLAEENETSFVIYDAKGAPHTVLREEVHELRASPLSVMPEGFEALPEGQIAGLLEFLTTSGDFVPLRLAGAANTASTEAMFTGAESDDPYFERLIFDTWGTQVFDGVPYYVQDPGDGQMPNLILLQSPHSPLVSAKPRSVTISCKRSAKAIHLLSGVSGWGYPVGEKDSETMIVRLQFADGITEDHPLLNGVHFADYIRVMDVPESRLAFQLGPRQLRQLTIVPEHGGEIESIEFLKGTDDSAPIVMAVTLEVPQGDGSPNP